MVWNIIMDLASNIAKSFNSFITPHSSKSFEELHEWKPSSSFGCWANKIQWRNLSIIGLAMCIPKFTEVIEIHIIKFIFPLVSHAWMFVWGGDLQIRWGHWGGHLQRQGYWVLCAWHQWQEQWFDSHAKVGFPGRVVNLFCPKIATC